MHARDEDQTRDEGGGQAPEALGPDYSEPYHLEVAQWIVQQAELGSQIRRHQIALEQAGPCKVNTVWEWMHGKPWTLDGISGRFLYSMRLAFYPTGRWVERLVHEADEAGKASAAYRDVKERLGDDWTTDVGESGKWPLIAFDMGVPDAVVDRMYEER